MDTARMTSFRALLADVLAESNFEWQIGEGRLAEGVELAEAQAHAILAIPEIEHLIVLGCNMDFVTPMNYPTLRALLADYRREHPHLEYGPA